MRGITEDFTVFITGTDLYKIRNDISEAYQFIDEDFNGDYYNIGLEFARAIINADIDRYTA